MPDIGFDSILVMVAAWIPIITGIYLLVGWMITDDLETVFGMIGIGVLLTIGYLCINPPTPALPRFLFPALYASYIVLPGLHYVSNRLSLKSVDVEAVESAYEVLNTRRENAGAQFRLAKALARLGHEGHALAIAENALHGQDPNIFREEFRDLHAWRLARDHAHIRMPTDVSCYNCHAPNPAGRVFCKVCGAPHLKALVKRQGFKSRIAGTLLGTWLVVLALIAAIPISAHSVPANLALIVILCEIGLALAVGILLWKRKAPI